MLPVVGQLAVRQPSARTGSISVKRTDHGDGSTTTGNGSKVRLGQGGVSVFRVVEVGVDGDPNRALVEEPKPGVHQRPTDIRRLVLADDDRVRCRVSKSWRTANG